MPSILVFITAVAVAFIISPLAGRLGRRLRLLDTPAGRRQHPHAVPRIGGVGLCAGFLVAAVIAFRAAPLDNPDDALRIAGVLIGCVFVFAVGLLDDWRDLRPGPQLIAQIAAALIAISSTVFIERFTNPLTGRLVILPFWLVVPVTVFWIAGMMNTVNWLDGLDGLAAGVGAIAALLFAVHMRSLGQPNVALYAIGLAAACLGFLPFNFSPARVFLGSAGAMVLGYALATLSILAPARVATALLVMAVPIADTAWQIFDRYRHGRSVFLGDRGHLHFRLVDRGLSQRRIVLLYWLFCAVFGTISLVLAPLHKFLAVGVLAIVIIGMLANLSGRPRQDDESP